MGALQKYMQRDADVVLQFDDAELPSHSQVISLWSEVLRKAARLSHRNSSSPRVIPMPGTKSSDWLTVAQFMYPGGQAELSWKNLKIVLMVADKYDMPDLINRATSWLDRNIKELNDRDDSRLYIWRWLPLLDATFGPSHPLCQECISLIAASFRDTLSPDKMRCLSRGAVEMLACALATTPVPAAPVEGDLKAKITTPRACKRCGLSRVAPVDGKPNSPFMCRCPLSSSTGVEKIKEITSSEDANNSSSSSSSSRDVVNARFPLLALPETKVPEIVCMTSQSSREECWER